MPTESIWEIMSRCALSEEEDRALKEYTEAKGLIYLSTPFSRAAAVRLHDMNVAAYKIGSGECNNYPLIQHVAAYGLPVILSTGMNDLTSIGKAVRILRETRVPFALMHCTSLYPTPYDKVRLGALAKLRGAFPDAVIGLSDHSLSIYPCVGAVALGAALLERHFTSDPAWPGPDIPISMTPSDLHELIEASRIVHATLGGAKEVLREEQPTIDFAYACVVSVAEIPAGAALSPDNVWVKRPGTGEIKAEHYEALLGRRSHIDIPKNTQIRWEWLEP